jgi:hypothetical protein
MRRVIALVPVVLVLALAGIAGALDGSPPSNVGWWSQDPSASAQPDGGFQVSGVAANPVSVAAVRFSTPSGVTSASLTLQESGGFVTPATGLQVCKTTAPWEPANPGAYADAPAPDCNGAVALERDADSKVWSASVGTLLPSIGGDASLMIVPAETAGGGSPVDPGFQVTFSGAALAVVSAPGTTTGPSTTFSSDSFGGSGGGSGGGGFGSSTFSAPGPVSPTSTLAPTTPDTAPGDAAPASGDAFKPPSLAAGATPGSGGGADQPWARLLFIVPLSALIGVAVVYAKRILLQRGVLDEA